MKKREGVVRPVRKKPYEEPTLVECGDLLQVTEGLTVGISDVLPLIV